MYKGVGRLLFRGRGPGGEPWAPAKDFTQEKIISLQPVIPEIVARMGGLKGLFAETHDRESQNS